MTYLLKLYITGRTPNSEKAIKNLEEFLAASTEKKYTLKIIDISKKPQLAEDEKILATPLLERKLPLPVRRIIGDLSDREKVVLGLDLVSIENDEE